MSKLLPRKELENICLQDVIGHLLPDEPPPMEHQCAIVAAALPPGALGSVHTQVFEKLVILANRGRHGFGVAGKNGEEKAWQRFLRPRKSRFYLHRTTVPIHQYANLTRTEINKLLKNPNIQIAGGQNRYATSGIVNSASAQPWVVDYLPKYEGSWLSIGGLFKHVKKLFMSRKNQLPPERDFFIGFNGNIANAKAIKRFLIRKGFEFPKGENTTDTDVLGTYIHYIDTKLEAGDGGRKSTRLANFEKIFSELDQHLDGACSLYLVDGRGNLVLYRNKYGFRPLEYIQLEDKRFYAASETPALKQHETKWRPIKSLEPGRILIRNAANGNVSIKQITEKPEYHLCAMEAVYFQRRDSLHYGKTANEIRSAFGRELAEQILDRLAQMSSEDRARVVIAPVPNTAIPYADAFARGLNLSNQHFDAIHRDPSAGRSFNASTEDREQILQRKYSFMEEHIKDKILWLVDDSMVRGTTSSFINKIAKEKLGAKEVHWFIGSPPVQGTCNYGIAIPTGEELLYWQAMKKLPEDIRQSTAAGADAAPLKEKMAELIGAESITFLNFDKFRNVLAKQDIANETDEEDRHCTACFGGRYPTRAGRVANDAMRAEHLKLAA